MKICSLCGVRIASGVCRRCGRPSVEVPLPSRSVQIMCETPEKILRNS